GLSPVSISPRAWERLQARREPPFTWYLDLQLLARYFEPPHVYHHTPSPPLYYAMHQALAAIEEEGLENRWARHQRAGQRLISGLTRLDFEPLVKKSDDRTWHLTTVMPPPEVNEAKLRETLITQFGIEIASGLGRLEGKILRIGTMGPLANDESVDYLLNAIETCL
ncbi:MAG: alanine--glyoxylate aminotransferase family protein, partial [Acidobacteriaceae bacterium]|nr:alanine--glyoxylate aminotransferase family protein [Acidobacteriaceae bacterium]